MTPTELVATILLQLRTGITQHVAHRGPPVLHSPRLLTCPEPSWEHPTSALLPAPHIPRLPPCCCPCWGKQADGQPRDCIQQPLSKQPGDGEDHNQVHIFPCTVLAAKGHALGRQAPTWNLRISARSRRGRETEAEALGRGLFAAPVKGSKGWGSHAEQASGREERGWKWKFCTQESWCSSGWRLESRIPGTSRCQRPTESSGP